MADFLYKSSCRWWTSYHNTTNTLHNTHIYIYNTDCLLSTGLSITEKTVLTPCVREFWEKLCGWVVPASDGGSLNIFAPLAASGKVCLFCPSSWLHTAIDMPFHVAFIVDMFYSGVVLYWLVSCRNGSDEEVVRFDWSECQSSHRNLYRLLPAQWVSDMSWEWVKLWPTVLNFQLNVWTHYYLLLPHFRIVQ